MVTQHTTHVTRAGESVSGQMWGSELKHLQKVQEVQKIRSHHLFQADPVHKQELQL